MFKLYIWLILYFYEIAYAKICSKKKKETGEISFNNIFYLTQYI